MISIAVVGAGMASASLVHALRDRASFTVFDKSRGCGGRMATRRLEGHQFDHGAQFMTARTKEFQAALDWLEQEGVVQRWQPRIGTLSPIDKPYKRDWFEPHWVGCPGMNAPVKAMLEETEVRTGIRVCSLQKTGDKWRLFDVEGESLGDYDWVVSTAPAPQSAELLPELFSQREALTNTEFHGCFALLLSYKQRLTLNFDAVVVKDSAVSWVVREHGKPDRPARESLVVHSDNRWADQHLNADLDTVVNELLMALKQIDVIGDDPPEFLQCHRWRYARTRVSPETDYLMDPTHRLAACGDWCLGQRVEDAFSSGHRLAGALRAHLRDD